MKQQVGVAGIINRGECILVVRRAAKVEFLPGLFDLPGGKVEFGESPQDAIRREIFEETSLKTEIIDLIDARSYLSKNGTQHNVELFYTLKELNDNADIKLCAREHDEYRWVTADEVNQLGLPEGDLIRDVIESYFTSVFNGTSNQNKCSGSTCHSQK
jgi:8-oxo-dGTP diphosphatase